MTVMDEWTARLVQPLHIHVAALSQFADLLYLNTLYLAEKWCNLDNKQGQDRWH